jgi:hypothetical protein
VDDVVADGRAVQVDLRAGGGLVAFEVNPYSPETPQVVERAAGVKLPEHHLKVGLGSIWLI